MSNSQNLPNFGHVWLIDDDPIVNYINEVTLKKLSHCKTISTFSSVEKSLETLKDVWLLNSQGPDIIFLDMYLISLGAIDFLKNLENDTRLEIQNHKSKVKIFILSSSEEAEAINVFLQSDWITGFLKKPLIENDLSLI